MCCRFFVIKQKTAYEMRISDWSSDVCSSDRISVVEMKMIRAVKVSTTGSVSVEMVFTCIGCPAWSMMQNDIRDAVSEVPGVTSASVKVVWDEPWRSEAHRVGKESVCTDRSRWSTEHEKTKKGNKIRLT